MRASQLNFGVRQLPRFRFAKSPPTTLAMFDDFLKDITRLQRRLERIEGTQSVSFADLFTDEFMLLHSDFQSISAMLDASGFRVESAEDFAAIPADEWDAFIKARSRFESWEAMRGAAGAEWMSRQLKDG